MSERMNMTYQETVDRFDEILARISAESANVKTLLWDEDLVKLSQAYTLIEEIKYSFDYLE